MTPAYGLRMSRSLRHTRTMRTLSLSPPIDDAEWRMDDRPELSDTELGNDTPALRDVGESLDRRNDFVEESLAALGHLTLAVPRTHPLKVVAG